MSKHWVLIANPTAGNARARSVAEQASLAIQDAGQAVELRYTRAKGHGAELAQQAVAEGAERLVVCGGDGTISEALAPPRWLAHGLGVGCPAARATTWLAPSPCRCAWKRP